VQLDVDGFLDLRQLRLGGRAPVTTGVPVTNDGMDIAKREISSVVARQYMHVDGSCAAWGVFRGGSLQQIGPKQVSMGGSVAHSDMRRDVNAWS
jgi:hypothetical protein